jgi:transposase
MAPYSMDLRKRVLRAWDAGMDAESVAAKYEVSRAWVHRLVQRRRETGSIAPRKQTKFRRRALADQEPRLAALIAARPDCMRRQPHRGRIAWPSRLIGGPSTPATAIPEGRLNGRGTRHLGPKPEEW